jgi:CHAD domain-containing protein
VKKFRRRLRTLIGALGRTREYDVLIGHIVRHVTASSVPQKTALGLLIGRYSLLRTRSHGELTLALRAFDEKNTLASFRRAVMPELKKHAGKPVTLGMLMRRVVPDLYLAFMVASTPVVNHPRRAAALHRLRIQGKPLRYAMELSQKCFGPVYERCYRDMKGVIELLGDIHDIDVTASTLSSYLEEIRIFNTPSFPSSSISIQTGFLIKAIGSLKAKRAGQFAELGGKLTAWRSGGFYGKLVRALGYKKRPSR